MYEYNAYMIFIFCLTLGVIEKALLSLFYKWETGIMVPYSLD